jgi:predicted secreted protein
VSRLQQSGGSLLLVEAVDVEGGHEVHDDHSDRQALRKSFHQQDLSQVQILYISHQKIIS